MGTVVSYPAERMVPTVHFVMMLLGTTHSLVILQTFTPEYCNRDDDGRQERMQPCSTDSDCGEGGECQVGQTFAFCFNHTQHYKIGCPCETHDDCPEACYSGREVPTCGPWLF